MLENIYAAHWMRRIHALFIFVAIIILALLLMPAMYGSVVMPIGFPAPLVGDEPGESAFPEFMGGAEDEGEWPPPSRRMIHV